MPPQQQTGSTAEEDGIRSKFLQSVTGKIKQKPELLKESTGTEVCCVFRVPQSLADINQKAYLPLIVSIGPYHNGRGQVKGIQEQKWRYLQVLISRGGVTLDTLFDTVLSMEEEIRNSYSEAIKLETCELVELMVLDACFVIELFCRATKVVKPEDNDPIFRIPWFLPYVLRDLLRLENQIPFVLVDKIYDLVRSGLGGGSGQGQGGQVPCLTELALKFFNRAVVREEKVIEKYYELKGVKHLLDLFCLSFMPPAAMKKKGGGGGLLSQQQQQQQQQEEHEHECCYCFDQVCLSLSVGNSKSSSSSSSSVAPKSKSKRRKREGFYSAMKLHQAGIKVEIRETESSFLDVKFVNGVLQVPRIAIDDFTASVLLNAIAFEQSYIHRQDYFTTYANFMGRLINTPADVGFLCDRGIVENYLGNDDEVVQFFNTVRKDVVIDLGNGYLKDVFQGIEMYRGTMIATVHASWAELWDKYFGSPWALASFMGALAALVLTAIQAYYAVNPKKQ